VTARVWADAVPVLSVARDYVQAGIAPGGTHANWKFLADWVTFDPELSKEEQLLLCDAQTSGGLLASVPAADADRLVRALPDAVAESPHAPTPVVRRPVTVRRRPHRPRPGARPGRAATHRRRPASGHPTHPSRPQGRSAEKDRGRHRHAHPRKPPPARRLQ